MKSLFIIVSVLAALCSCRKEPVENVAPEGTMLIKVSLEETKVAIGNGTGDDSKTLSFSAGDKISVFANGENNCFTTANGGKTALFSGTADQIDGYYYVVSPYSKTSTIASDNRITVNIPAVQKAVKGSVDPEAMVSVGRARTGESLELLNVPSLVKVVVPEGARYKQIELACSQKEKEVHVYNQSISGEISIDYTGAMSVSSDADKRSTTITLVPSGGETVIGPGEYYIATRPGTYRIGLTFVTEDDRLFIRKSGSDSELVRSHIHSAGELDRALFTDITAPATLATGATVNLAVKKLANASVSAVTEDDLTITSVAVKTMSLGGLVGKFALVSSSSSAHPVYARLAGTELTFYTPGRSLVLNENSMGLFRNFKALSSLDFSAFDASAAQNMTRAFAQSGFETLDLSSLKGDNVSSLNYAFENCTSLVDVDLSGFSGKSLTDFSFAFSGCSALEKLNLVSAHTDKVTNFKACFSACKAVSELHLGYYFTLDAVSDLATGCKNMFYNTSLAVSQAGSKCDLYCTNEFYNAMSLANPGKAVTAFNAARFNLHAITAGINLLSDSPIYLVRGRKAYAKISVVPVELENVSIEVSSSPYFTSLVEPGELPGEYLITFEDSKVALNYKETLTVTASFSQQGEPKSYQLNLAVNSSEANSLDTGLPIVMVETPGGVEIKDKETWIEGSKLLILNPDMTVSYEGGMSVKGRGNNTWQFEKKPYAIKLDEKSPILGMKSHKRWCLLANYVDRTLMRNEIAYAIGRMTSLAWTPSGKFVECFVNGVHRGCYYLCEQIKVDKNRVNIADLEPGVPDGGYLFEFDDYFDEAYKFRSLVRNLPVQFKDPDEVEQCQFDFAQSYINNMEEALYDDGRFAAREYLDYMDIQSYADYYLVIELTQNLDACVPKSFYMHKDKGGKMTAGPLWDFDYATFKKDPLLPARTGYNFIAQGENQGHYFHRLMQDPQFRSLVRERWDAMKPALATIPDYIDATADAIRKSEEKNHAMWPIDDRFIAGDEQMTFDQAVATLKEAYKGKYDFLDANLSATAPPVTSAGPKISIFGDSISTYAGYIQGYTTYYPYGSLNSVDMTYWMKLIQMTEGTLEKNISYSGSCVSYAEETFECTASGRSYPLAARKTRCFHTRYAENGIGDPDILLLYGGTNDRVFCKGNVPRPGDVYVENGAYFYSEDGGKGQYSPAAGEVEALCSTASENLDTDYFMPAYVLLLRKIFADHPKVKIACLVGDGMTDAQDAWIKGVTEYFSTHGYAGRIKTVSFHNAGNYDGKHYDSNIPKVSGVHPNEQGMTYMANFIYNEIQDWL